MGKRLDRDLDKDQLIQEFLKGGDKTKRTNNNRTDDYLSYFTPLEVTVYGNNFDRAFKAFRAIVQKERMLSDYKQRQSYEKPSVKKRRKRNEMRKKMIELETKQQKILSGEFEKELQKKQFLKEQKLKDKLNK